MTDIGTSGGLTRENGTGTVSKAMNEYPCSWYSGLLLPRNAHRRALPVSPAVSEVSTMIATSTRVWTVQPSRGRTATLYLPSPCGAASASQCPVLSATPPDKPTE